MATLNSEIQFFEDQKIKVAAYNTCTQHNSYHYFRLFKSFKSKTPITWPGNQLTKGHVLEIREEKKELLKVDTTLLNSFMLRFYMPVDALSRRSATSSEDPKIKHVVIMVNGLDEYKQSFFQPYDFLGSHFAQQNIATVLLSTPFHLHRTVKRDFTDGQSNILKPSTLLTEDWMNVFHHYRQTYEDVLQLVSYIKQEINEPNDFGFYKNHFARDVKVSILGYSLGGLISLGCYLDNAEVFNRCVLYNAPGDLSKADPRMINIPRQLWEKLCTQLNRTSSHAVISNNDSFAKYQSFSRIYSKDGPDEDLAERIKLNKSAILQVIAGQDRVIDREPWDKYFLRKVPNSDLKEMLISQHVFSGIGHNTMLDSRGSELMPRIAELMADHLLFDEQGHWQDSAIRDALKKLLQPTKFFKQVAPSNLADPAFPRTLTKSDIRTILRQITTDAAVKGKSPKEQRRLKDEFLRLYYLSKIYYPKFYDLLAHILQSKQ